MLARQVTGIEALDQCDARVVQHHLAVAHVDGGDMGGTLFQQHLREAAGRGADIESAAALRGNIEMAEAMLQLQRGARYIVLSLIGKGNDSIEQNQQRRLGRRHAINPHGTAQDGIAGPRTRGVEAVRNQQLVEALPIRHPVVRCRKVCHRT